MKQVYRTMKLDEPHICSPTCRGPGDPDTHGYPGDLSDEIIDNMDRLDQQLGIDDEPLPEPPVF